jgi:repressor LexA
MNRGGKGGGTKANTLAPVQRETLEYLRNFITERGYSPSLRNIADYINVKSLSTAHFHLERLEQKGFIKRGDEGGVELIESAIPLLGPTSVPLVGIIAAGLPIEAIEHSSSIELPSSMVIGRGEVFCLEVSGDSMIDAHICDRDIVVVSKQDHAQNGDIIVALLDDGTATLKTFRRLKNGKTMLIPANARLTPIVVDKVTVQGKVVGVFRNLQ